MVLAPLASGERRHAGEREPRLDRCVCARGDESFWEVTDAEGDSERQCRCET